MNIGDLDLQRFWFADKFLLADERNYQSKQERQEAKQSRREKTAASVKIQREMALQFVNMFESMH